MVGKAIRQYENLIISVYITDSAQIAKIMLINDLDLLISLSVHSSIVESTWIFPGSREAQVGLEVEPTTSQLHLVTLCRYQSNSEPMV